MHHEVQQKPEVELLPFHLSFSCSQTQDSDVSPALPGVPANLQILLIGRYPTLWHRVQLQPWIIQKYKIHRDPLSCGENLWRNLK